MQRADRTPPPSPTVSDTGISFDSSQPFSVIVPFFSRFFFLNRWQGKISRSYFNAMFHGPFPSSIVNTMNHAPSEITKRGNFEFRKLNCKRKNEKKREKTKKKRHEETSLHAEPVDGRSIDRWRTNSRNSSVNGDDAKAASNPKQNGTVKCWPRGERCNDHPLLSAMD